MDIKLKDYTKGKNDKTITRSVSIEQRHKDFIEAKDINLSSLVRDVIESLMREAPAAVKKK